MVSVLVLVIGSLALEQGEGDQIPTPHMGLHLTSKRRGWISTVSRATSKGN